MLLAVQWQRARGRLNSNPAAFEPDQGAPAWQAGDPQKLCALLGPGAGAAAVDAILREDYVDDEGMLTVGMKGQRSRLLCWS